MAASGGYWLACAGDEIYADESSIIGSIGVISAGFGFVEAIDKLGIERRVHTSGESKSMLDPFQPEKQEDVDHLLSLQADVHQCLQGPGARRRRGASSRATKGNCSPAPSGPAARRWPRGLIDGIGHLHQVLKQKFGDKVVIRNISAPQGWGLKRLGFGAQAPDFAASAIDAIETRAIWSRFGL